MNKLVTAILASAFLCISTFSPVWADGWGKTNWGMNIPEVEKATEGKLILYGQDIATQVYSHKFQDNISIGKYNFEVYLNFESSKLDRVILKLVSTEAYESYLYLVDELEKKYGSPSVGPKEKRMSSGKINDAEWVTKDTVIRLSYALLVFQGTHETTIIKYSSRQSASSGNL